MSRRKRATAIAPVAAADMTIGDVEVLDDLQVRELVVAGVLQPLVGLGEVQVDVAAVERMRAGIALRREQARRRLLRRGAR